MKIVLELNQQYRKSLCFPINSFYFYLPYPSKYYWVGIEAIFFSNPSNFYKVLLIEIDETNAEYDDFEIVVNGTIGDVVEGDSYTFYGQFTQHPRYGEHL